MKDKEQLGTMLPEHTVMKLRSLKAALVFYDDLNGGAPEPEDDEEKPSAPSSLE